MAEIAKQAEDAGEAKDLTTAKDDTVKAIIKEAIETSVEEVKDEVVPDSEYGSSTTPSPKQLQLQLKNLPHQYETALWVV